jgi:uncharacterized FlaG/YvyC family protein
LDQRKEKQTTLTITKLKQQLDNLMRGMAFNLHHPNPTKRIIYKILNTSAAETIKDIYSTDIVPPAELIQLIREIDRLKKNFISKHQHEQSKQVHHNERKTFFYFITKHERALIENITHLLTQNMTVQSLIWLLFIFV